MHLSTPKVLERIEVPNKTIQLPSQQEKGRSMASPKAATSRKRTRKQRDEPSKPVNATQPQVEKDQVDIPNPHPTSIEHSNSDDGTSEHLDNVVLGNTK